MISLRCVIDCNFYSLLYSQLILAWNQKRVQVRGKHTCPHPSSKIAFLNKFSRLQREPTRRFYPLSRVIVRLWRAEIITIYHFYLIYNTNVNEKLPPASVSMIDIFPQSLYSFCPSQQFLPTIFRSRPISHTFHSPPSLNLLEVDKVA